MSGCALGLTWIASEIWMNSVSGEDSRGTIMGIYGTVFSIGIIGGPVLLEFTGTRGWRPFVIGALCLVSTLLPLAVLRRVRSATREFAPLGGLMGARARRSGGHARGRWSPDWWSPRISRCCRCSVCTPASASAPRCCWSPCSWRATSSCRCPSACSRIASAAGFCSGICALLSGIGPLLLPACIDRPVLTGALAVRLGRHLVCVLQSGRGVAGRAIPDRGPAARQHRVRDGVLPGWGDRAESGRHCHGYVAFAPACRRCSAARRS